MRRRRHRGPQQRPTLKLSKHWPTNAPTDPKDAVGTMNQTIQQEAVANPPSGVTHSSVTPAGMVVGRPVGLDAPARPRFARLPSGARGMDARAKRVVDAILALTLLLLLVPVCLLVALAVRLDSPGPLLFRARRVGHRGRPLDLLKFRKMRHGATGLTLTTDQDRRFTRIGALLARTKLDELPQLWQVVRGDLSLVGPRPEDLAFVSRYGSEYEAILDVRPGITGLSQIAFAEEGKILDDEDPLGHYVDRLLPQKVALDRMYARTRTLRMDLRILFWTGLAILMRRQVAVHRESGKMNLRRR